MFKFRNIVLQNMGFAENNFRISHSKVLLWDRKLKHPGKEHRLVYGLDKFRDELIKRKINVDYVQEW